MSDWGVLGLEGDPTPGDPDAVRAMAVRLRGQADLAESGTARLRAIASSGGELAMAGDYAPAFTEALVELPDGLAKLARAYRGCGDALFTFANGLTEAKAQAGGALRGDGDVGRGGGGRAGAGGGGSGAGGGCGSGAGAGAAVGPGCGGVARAGGADLCPWD
ncbi:MULTISPECIES: hypothetical protein [unclassified Frankia]|uniref:hypothetical protein n=1 Tax=unclassified Frankia TaxID=2632575 RepID=UPI002AD45281|nr:MULTISPECIES: hypothetical protein [unclassified Frankia]